MKYFFAMGVLATLAACGSADKNEPAPPPAPPQATVFDPMVKQLDRAKQQAETLPKERKENLDNAIDSDSK